MNPRIFKPVKETSTNSEMYKLIKEAIEKAKISFINGIDANKKFRKQIEENPEKQKDIWITEFAQRYLAEHKDCSFRDFLPKFPQYKDADFPHINANKIKGTRFIAAEGPESSQKVESFFKDTVFNQKKPIKEFVLLASCLGLNPNKFQDFHAYCVQPDNMKAEEKSMGAYRLQVKKISGSSVLYLNGEQVGITDAVVKTEMTIFPDKSESKEDAKSKTAFATIFRLEDMCSLDLSLENKKDIKKNECKKADADDLYEDFESEYESRDEKKDELLKATIWEIYQKSLKEDIVIHCSAGVGRTGHLILTLELLKLFVDPEFFIIHKTPDEIKDVILKTVDRIRENRPALIATDNQFTKAIHNAYAVYKYALENKLIEQKTISEDKTSISTSFAI